MVHEPLVATKELPGGVPAFADHDDVFRPGQEGPEPGLGVGRPPRLLTLERDGTDEWDAQADGRVGNRLVPPLGHAAQKAGRRVPAELALGELRKEPVGLRVVPQTEPGRPVAGAGQDEVTHENIPCSRHHSQALMMTSQ
jgi:hypothetical protein